MEQIEREGGVRYRNGPEPSMSFHDNMPETNVTKLNTQMCIILQTFDNQSDSSP